MTVARVSVGESLDPNQWTYWSGTAWVAGESNAAPAPGLPLVDDVIPLRDDSGYMGVGVGGSAGRRVGGSAHDDRPDLLLLPDRTPERDEEHLHDPPDHH